MYYIINTTNQTQECKMFISVADTRDPITVYNALSPFRKGIREFLPQHFFNILSHTNHHVSIKEALFLVDELPQDKHINFKDAIISAIEHRETTEFNKNKMITFAKEGGYLEEFEKADKKMKYLEPSFRNNNICVVYDSYLENDYSQYDKLICDFSQSFIMQNSCKLPKILDVSRCMTVNFTNADISNLEKIKFKKGAQVKLSFAKLPKKLNVTDCEVSGFLKSDYSQLEEITFTNRHQKESILPNNINLKNVKIKFAQEDDIPDNTPKREYLLGKYMKR